ncbi:MAG TPA: hypothetical protein VMV94_12160 [Phycisphaerae bacterium]|nr:hypothetical protein [Phycisphaerae bacterium]
MTTKTTRESERFEAITDDGSYQTTIVVLQDFIETRTLDGHHDLIPEKNLRFETIGGFVCNRLDDDRFQIVNAPLHSGCILRRVAGR